MNPRLANTSWLALLLLFSACLSPAPPGFDEGAWRGEVEAWRAERDQGLRDPEGWLTLAGLFWLNEGANTFGSEAGNDLVFPTGKAPGRIGALVRTGERVALTVEPGTGLAADGTPVSVPELALAVEGKPTLLTLGSLSFHIIRRGERVGVRLKDKASPVLANFNGIESFPLASTWRVVARFEAYEPPKTIQIPNVLGDVSEADCPGALVFERNGQKLRLEPTGEPGEEMFLVFGDATNGHETYGGGRFLAVPPPAKDGTVVVDFNQAYNPPCVFTPYATCPLPPRQNRLSLRVEAGEKMYAAGVAHVVDTI